MNNHRSTIIDPPLEMICELFRYLGLKYLVTCSMVNKRWHSVYSVLVKLEQLNVTLTPIFRDDRLNC